MIHTINLKEYDEIIQQVIPLVNNDNVSEIMKPQLKYQLNQIMNGLIKIRGSNSRIPRSINWIGSAWKWLAGSPDATDWDNLLKAQNQLATNNNKQYKINHEVMALTNEIIRQYNHILKQLENKADINFEQVLFNKLGIIKEAINEIVLAIELAKRGIVNTNLLSQSNIEHIIKEVDTLPYSNDVEAVEFADPKVITNGQTVLYILSLPKTNDMVYDHLIVRPTIKNQTQVYLQYQELLVSIRNNSSIFGIKSKCNNINKAVFCKANTLEKLEDNHCMNQLIRGVDAKCDFQFNQGEVIELINPNTIFLTNFNGTIKGEHVNKHLTGSFLVQYRNETICIKDQNFTSTQIDTSQVLPAYLQTNLSRTSMKHSFDYLHILHLNNTEKLQTLSSLNKASIAADATISFIILTTIVIVILITKKQCSTVSVAAVTQETACPIPPLRLNIDLRDVDL